MKMINTIGAVLLMCSTAWGATEMDAKTRALAHLREQYARTTFRGYALQTKSFDQYRKLLGADGIFTDLVAPEQQIIDGNPKHGRCHLLYE